MLSVVICTYNRCKYIYGVLSRLAKNSLATDRYEIILVDNNCTDKTPEEAARFNADFPKVNFKYCREATQGVSYARNKGVRMASGNVIVFLDDEAFPGPDYLATIDMTMREHPEIDCFGGKVTPFFETGEAPSWFCKQSYYWLSSLDLGDKLGRFRKHSFPVGANMGIRSKVFTTCRGFNSNFGIAKNNYLGGEIKDFFLRARRNGFNIYYMPGIEVKHVIPENRTTMEYISKIGQGIGISERTRCKGEGSGSYLRRVILEGMNWIRDLILSLIYKTKKQPEYSKALMTFRRNVTKTLMSA